MQFNYIEITCGTAQTINNTAIRAIAAELLARLMVEVKKSMEFDDMESILWTDSSITLYWIRKPPASLKTFVANRVKSIQENSDLKCWHYVNTKQNPADLLSRGAKPSELVDNKLWLHGPEWLQLPESQWPQEQFPLTPKYSETLELRVHTVTEFRSALDIGEEIDELGQENRKPILEYAISQCKNRTTHTTGKGVGHGTFHQKEPTRIFQSGTNCFSTK